MAVGAFVAPVMVGAIVAPLEGALVPPVTVGATVLPTVVGAAVTPGPKEDSTVGIGVHEGYGVANNRGK